MQNVIAHTKASYPYEIKAFVLLAHGNEDDSGSGTVMYLGAENITKQNYVLLDSAIKTLDPNTNIIAWSCRTGKESDSQDLSQGNLLQQIAYIAEGRKVFGSTTVISGQSEIRSDYSLKPVGIFFGLTNLIEPDTARCFQNREGAVISCN
ncbi:MAG: hypothetical protein EBR59_10565 [Methylococcaceae bacterium]|nr:hypothetical protein [Methylococcaceae bacterium]